MSKNLPRYMPIQSDVAQIGLLLLEQRLTGTETPRQRDRLDAICPTGFAEAVEMYLPTKHDLKEKRHDR
jgi:hypothetical protein